MGSVGQTPAHCKGSAVRVPASLLALPCAVNGRTRAGAGAPVHSVAMERAFAYLIAGWSGYFVMALELLGGRALAPYFGSSIHVWGAIITVFMLALSLGYLAGGAWSRRSPSQARLALLLAGAALCAVPVALGSDALLDALSARLADPRLASLCAALALFFVPTAVSGMISPYAVRLLVDERAGAGAAAGRLYFVSTFGSAAGTLLTSFYLVLYFELATLLWAMIGVSIALASAALLWRPAARA